MRKQITSGVQIAFINLDIPEGECKMFHCKYLVHRMVIYSYSIIERIINI
jgi:hypothetical protein